MGEQERTVEELFQELEDTIGKMQQREVSLEDSFSLYEQGIQTLRQCNEKIDRVEKKMQILNEQGQIEFLDIEQ